ncbi:DNA polymerase/3'-5' exonuclease PolX [Halochromatium glycolicum]|uniref:DNA polymerase beta n=1 Tax=Halochromatium glycolicum TaxID=85075 RepID=A0AAJ0U8J7_9GAMM|nr:DNA polymerase/3'-5' exonuclease PolX [Halochromatium glycolicum]MBK1707326.1 DNA polymerase III [Halochromatium glycolicum]
MTIHNQEIADRLERAADLLEIGGGNAYRARAYRQAAQTISGLSQSVADLVANGDDLTELPDIGQRMAEKIATLVETGELPQLDELKETLPAQLSELMQLSGLGPKRVKALYQDLGVENLDDLKQALEAHRVRELEGFGRKTEETIAEHLARRQGQEPRTRLMEAEEIAQALAADLRAVDGVQDLAIAGSFRRRKETVGDLDILVTAVEDSPVMARFTGHEEVREIVSQGETRSTIVLRSGMQVDLRRMPEAAYGAALHYFTGSKAHNIAVRRMGMERGLKINEYGVFRDEERIAGRSEQEVYASVGLPYIEPVLRENRGEIEAAQEGSLPELVELDAIRGDLHCHTRASDGHESLRAMAEAGAERGYQYLAITDHTQNLTVAGGLDERRMNEQIDRIDRLNDTLGDRIRVLKSAEVDILADGSLDLPDAILERLDLCVCSIHDKLDLSREKQTERILRAMDHPSFSILGHPRGRLIGKRDPYELDLEQVLAAAAERGCFLEVNAQPKRLDLSDTDCRLAKEMGVKVAISTDAHSRANLDYMRFGVDQARRGWLDAEDVVNTRSLEALRKLLERP